MDPPSANAVGVLELGGIAVAVPVLLAAAIALAIRQRERARPRELAGNPVMEEDMEGGSVIDFEDDGGPAALAWSESEAITSMEESMPGGDPTLGDAVRSSLAAMGAASTLVASLKDPNSGDGVFI